MNQAKICENQAKSYDVVIVGAGIAGVCQARHLLLNVPGIKVAIVDPRPEERTDKDTKVGESTVEISTLMLGKELGLYDYMVENHPPKFGLNFHWPKDFERTESTEDYYHLWAVKQPPLASVLINRPRFERDLLKMDIEMGATFYQGRVVDIDILPADELNTLQVKLAEGSLELKAQHIVDAAGRRFLLSKKTENLVQDLDKLYGVNTGAAWIRVRNVDRSIFHDGYDPNTATCSHYYSTNHWMGHGHWIWMIPTDTDNHELSVGLVYHHELISPQTVNSKEKFYAFLKANHNVLYRLLKSGDVEVDFNHFPKLAYKSKMLYSRDNWYVIGDAAAFFDPYYSQGLTMLSFQLNNVTEIVRAKVAGEVDVEKKRAFYNKFAINMVERSNILVSRHTRMLGDASIMTWRMYLENMWWFKFLVPMYLGKWYLDLDFLQNVASKPGRIYIIEIMNAVYDHLEELTERKVNLGFMYTHISHQLPFGFKMSTDFDDFLHLAKYEPQKLNIFACLQWTHFFVALFYLKLLWKGYGIRGVLSLKNLRHVYALFKASALAAWDHLVFRYKTKDSEPNHIIASDREEFKNYQAPERLVPWSESTMQPLAASNAAPVKALTKV
jgi:flavin-dependent dehydrogenase